MGVVNTTYTFTGTDTITSSKLNNIIDDTTFTGDAISGSTLQIVSPGKLAVAAGGITSNELANNSVTTNAIADANVTTAKIADANVTQEKLANNVVGKGPVFRAYQSSSQTIADGTQVKINLQTKNFDSNSNFASSRFTPTVAGYYLINGGVTMTSWANALLAIIYKNGSGNTVGSRADGYSSVVSDIIYMNGSSDYIELYALHQSGTNKTSSTGSNSTYLSGCLIRSA